MTPWIRVDGGIGESLKVIGFAKELQVTVAAAVGHLVLCWGQVAIHAVSGDIGAYPNDVLERWAQWTGKHDRFATAFRQTFAPNGTINDWGEHQGKLIERRLKERDRKRCGNPAEVPRSFRGSSAETPRNGDGNSAETPRKFRGKKCANVNENENGNENETRQTTEQQQQLLQRAREPWETAWETEVRTLLPEEYHPDLDAVLRGSQRPAALLAELRLALRGEKLGCEGAQPHHVGAALRDCTLSPGPVTGGKLAGFIRGAMSPTVRTAPTAPLDEFDAARRKFREEEQQHGG